MGGDQLTITARNTAKYLRRARVCLCVRRWKWHAVAEVFTEIYVYCLMWFLCSRPSINSHTRRVRLYCCRTTLARVPASSSWSLLVLLLPASSIVCVYTVLSLVMTSCQFSYIHGYFTIIYRPRCGLYCTPFLPSRTTPLRWDVVLQDDTFRLKSHNAHWQPIVIFFF